MWDEELGLGRMSCLVRRVEDCFCCAVSQFTLYGIMKGNKPDFHVAMSPDRARPFYNSVVERFGKAYRTDAVKGTDFGFLVINVCLRL